jgi:PPOX class probable F420-dependent enzyme
MSAARGRLAAARVARLASVTPSGVPHQVPITLVLLGGDRIVTAVDHKPKATRDLQRLRNIRACPRVCVLADHYDEDWARLWWVRADGEAAVVTAGATVADATTALQEKYAQYRDRPPEGPVILIRVTTWAWWQAGAT